MPDDTGPAAAGPALSGPGTEATGTAECWRIHLPHTTAAVPIARALIRNAFTDLDAGGTALPDRDTAELLTAELVANAVEHTAGAGPIELVVALLAAPDGCRIEVHDSRPADPGGLPCPAPDAEVDPWQEHGRGLLLVRALSSDCGHRPTTDGKAVWFTLPRIPSQRRHPNS
ncbi:ATP-binding protein [Streptomyces sp. SP18ES09]|uniref:ATP-binding protein n=1 Tax=Streptomyces sp. SP18ES09 TaxID=3002532 RepID=UPI002E75EE4F|nr:ATP-binding protein [Streptomyces sp. SP18ES09]MEE1819498.1 ATP-binding protein [Streptomyces sp. SP18ES09]